LGLTTNEEAGTGGAVKKNAMRRRNCTAWASEIRLPPRFVEHYYLGMKAVGTIGKHSHHFHFHIFIQKRIWKRKSSVGKTKSNAREIEIETIRSEACR